MTDVYTKGVLAIIAVALSILALQGFVGKSLAQANNIQKVQICDANGNCASLFTIYVAAQQHRITESYSLETHQVTQNQPQ